MKRIFIILLCSFAGSSIHAGCIVRRIVNNTTNCEILIRSVIIPGLEKSPKPNVVMPRSKKGFGPRIVDTKNKLGMGEYMRILVTEKTRISNICKKYRFKVDEVNKELITQKKDGCTIGLLEYDTVTSDPIDPDNCYVDLYLEDGVDSLKAQVTSDKDAPTYAPKSEKQK